MIDTPGSARLDERKVPAEDYVFPESIVLDEAGWAEFCAELENPQPANDVLRALLKR